MKNFTRIAALLLSIAIIFGLTGCDSPVTEPTPTTEANGTTTQTDLETPLTLEAIEAGQLIVTNPWSTFKYKKNGGEFQTVTATEPDVNNHGMYATIEAAQGDKFEFFADGSENDTAEHPLNFSYRNGSCNVYGNVMSLLDSENFATLKEITTEKAFEELFGNNPRGIINHNEKNLVLPATTLSKACYRAMFFGARISKAPNLPATTLAESCYDNMFSCCQNLTQTPELPAPILVKDCYKYMFYYSPNVNYVKCLATDISAEDCTYAWLGSVADTGTFVRANGVEWSRNESGIPAAWSEETLIPEYSISCSDSLISLSKTSAMEGEEITISVNNVVSIYDFSVTKNNSNEEIQLSGSNETRTFTMPAQGVTVRASYQISVYAGLQNGTMSASMGSDEVNHAYPGDTVTVTASPDSGFRLKNFSLTYVGNDMGAQPFTQNGNTCTFTMPNGSVSVSGSFEKDIIGTKTKPNAVGDIVFNDGTALPASEYETRELTDREKENAIAVVADVYEGQAMAVGLKQEYLPICSNTSQGYTNTAAFSHDGDAGQTRQEICYGENDYITDYSQANYPAIYWAQNYKGFNNLKSINNDWFIPTKQELLYVYAGKESVIAAINKIGSQYADPFIKQDEDEPYYSTVTNSSNSSSIYQVNLNNGSTAGQYKDTYSPVLVIRYFSCGD